MTMPNKIDYDNFLYSGPGGPHDDDCSEEEGIEEEPEQDYIEVRNGQSLRFEGNKLVLAFGRIQACRAFIKVNNGDFLPYKNREVINLVLVPNLVNVQIKEIRGNCVRLKINAPESVSWDVR